MKIDVETIVVGAGVVGLAIARRLARSGREVLVLEQEAHFGSATSSRNSEVIHAGIYYPAGSLKAQFCVEGRHRLYDYCRSRAIAHQRCGKLIVATSSDQHGSLDTIAQRAALNGVADLQRLDAAQAAELEPQIHCVSALLSPSTGIIDSHALMLSLLGEAEGAGALLACHAPVEQAVLCVDGSFQVTVGGADPMQLNSRELINAAGHGACTLARCLASSRTHSQTHLLPRSPTCSTIDSSISAREDHDPRQLPEPVLAKGSYFRLQGPAPARHLIYPVPEPGGLGVHITLDLAGQARFGPDVEWVDTMNHAVDPGRAERFYSAIRRYWPALPDQSLHPDYAGIRPKIRLGGEIYPDFLIQTPDQHGIERCIQLFGIESPGLTACLAIAQAVEQHLQAARI